MPAGRVREPSPERGGGGGGRGLDLRRRAGTGRGRVFGEARGPLEVGAGGAASRTGLPLPPPRTAPGGDGRAGFGSAAPGRGRNPLAGPAPRPALRAHGWRSGAARAAGGHVRPSCRLLPAGAEQDGVGGAAAAAGAAPGGLGRLRLRLVGAGQGGAGGWGGTARALTCPPDSVRGWGLALHRPPGTASICGRNGVRGREGNFPPRPRSRVGRTVILLPRPPNCPHRAEACGVTAGERAGLPGPLNVRQPQGPAEAPPWGGYFCLNKKSLDRERGHPSP